MYKKFLIAFDGSEGSKKALIQGIKLAKITGGELLALWVKGSLPHYPETIDEVEEEKEAANGFMEKIKEDITLIAKQENMQIDLMSRSGNPSKVIIDYAKENHIDLIIMGHRGHSGLWGNLLGHVTDKVSECAHCDVLIVR